MENVLLNYRVERNKKLNRVAKFGYFAAATYDPYGLMSLMFGIIIWLRGAKLKQVSGFGINGGIHIVASAIFDIYFNDLTGTIIYSIIFATAIPIILYRLTAAPTTTLLLADIEQQVLAPAAAGRAAT